MRRRGVVVVLSAPSGSGKTTLTRALLRRCPGMVASVSATTRPPRPGERRGQDYCFVSPQAFERMRRRGELVEWATVFGHRYGTPRRFVERQLRRGRDVVLTIDVQGAAQVRRRMPEAVSIFILPPTMQELQRRLVGRGSDAPAMIARRLRVARQELRQLPAYDYAVVNDTVTQAVEALAAIVQAEHHRVRRGHTNVLHSD